MDDQYIVDETMLKKAKSARTLSIVALVLAGGYFIWGVFTFLFSLIPIPVIGLIFSIVFSVVEFALLVTSIVLCIIALVKALKLVKAVNALPEGFEKDEALKNAKLSRTLAIIAVCITGVCFVMFFVLNIIEIILSIF